MSYDLGMTKTIGAGGSIADHETFVNLEMLALSVALSFYISGW